jgi:hypothetical protein
MNSISRRELDEWIALEKIEPLPDSWMETGLLASLIFNALSKGSKKSPRDFIPTVPDTRPQSAAAGLANMRAIAAAFEAAQSRKG